MHLRGFSRATRALVVVLCHLLIASLLPTAAAASSHDQPGDSPGREEMVAERTESSKTFHNPDGTLTTAVYPAPIHFRRQGRWEEIDTQLEPASKPGYAWQNGANSFDVSFKEVLEDDYLRIAAGDRTFTLGVQGAAAAPGRQRARGVGYGDAFPGVDVEYDLTPHGVKETLVVDNAQAPTRYRFLLESDDVGAVTAEELPNGSWAIFASPHPDPLLVLEAPYAFDSADLPGPAPADAETTPAPGESTSASPSPSDAPSPSPSQAPVPDETGDASSASPSPSDAASPETDPSPDPSGNPDAAVTDEASPEASAPVQARSGASDEPSGRDGSSGSAHDPRNPHAAMKVSELRPGTFAIDLAVDPTWLHDPARVFPAFIDPTITIQPSSLDAWFDNNCATCPAYLENKLRIGTDETVARSALQFDLESTIPPSANITSAKLGLQYDEWQIGSNKLPSSGYWNLAAHRVSQPWNSSSTTAAMKFDSTALSTYKLSTTATTHWMSWDVTGSIANMVAGAAPNYGFIIKRDTEPKQEGGPAPPSSRANNAAKWPKLEVTYTSEAVALFPPETLHSNGAELRWSRFDTASGAAFSRYEVHRAEQRSFTPTQHTRLATIEDVDVTSYRDTTAAASKSFTYKVVANTSASVPQTVALPAPGLAKKTLQLDASAADQTTLTEVAGSTTCANYGGHQQMWLGASKTERYRGILRFDLRDIPVGSKIRSSSLSLYHPFTINTAHTLRAHRVTGAFKEGTGLATCTGDGATWYETGGGARWASEGGDFASAAETSLSIPAGETERWHDFDLSGLTQKWVDGASPNHGVLLKVDDEALQTTTTSKKFSYYADDFAVTPSLRPKVEILYEDGSKPVAPTVAVSSPSDGSTVSGSAVSFVAAASDDGRVDRVEFFVDGASIGTDTTGPFEVSWDSTKSSNGSHSLTVTATDDAGNASTSSAATVTVQNSAPPSASITAPSSGSTIKGTQTVTANASDDLGVTRVEFYVDGILFGDDASAPYSADWNTLDSTSPAYDGPHTLTVKAFDSHGQSATSTGVDVTVANTSATRYQTGFASSAVPPAMTFDPAATAQQTQPVDVTVTNKSSVAWSATDLELRYQWFTPTGAPLDSPTGAVALGSDQIVAGDSRTKQLGVVPPSLPDGVDRSQYVLRFDLYDKTAGTSFAAKGNKPLENPVVVNKAIMSTALGLERYYHYTAQELGAGMAQLTNVASGNSLLRWTPFSAPGRGLSTVVDLTYNSLENRSDSPIGNNFSLAISSLTRLGLPLDVHPNKADDIAGRSNKWIEFTDADGTTHRFTGKTAADGSTYWEEPTGVHLYLREFSSTDATRKWALTRPDGVTFLYDADGYPTSVKDRNGNVLEFTLENVPPGEDPGGFTKRVTKVTDAAGTGSSPAANRSFTIDYYSKAEATKPQVRGKIESIKDHNGSTLRFDYYDDGNLLRLTQVGGTNADGSSLAGRALVFTYTTADGSAAAIADPAARRSPDPKTANQSTRLFSVRDPRGNESTLTYYAAASAQDRWKLKTLTDRAGEVTSFGYDITNRRTTVTQPLGRASIYAYDTEGKITSITDPLARVTTVRWNAERQVDKVTEPGDSFSEYSYNDNGYLTQQRVLTHNGDDGQAATSDDVIATTELTYDNRPVDAGDASGRWKTGRTIPHLSLLKTKTDPKGVATASVSDDFQWLFDHDQAGNLVKVSDPEGFSTSYGYNADGTLASITDARQKVTTLGPYDPNGFPREMRDPMGNVTEFGYDDDGLLRWVQSPRNSSQATTRHNATHFDYDSFHRLGVQSTPKDDNVVIWTAATFDDNDNVTASFAPESGNSLTRGQKTAMAYDSMDRQTLVTSPDASVDPAGERTSYTYDAAGRVTRVTRPKGVQSPGVADDHTTLLRYDDVDRVVKRSRPEVDGTSSTVRTLNTHFCYNTAGDLTRVTAPKAGLESVDCGSAAADFTTQYVYDAAHRLRRQTDPEGNTTSVTYDLNGNRDTVTDAKLNTTTFSYDERNLRTKIAQPFNGARDITTRFEYDAVGNLKRLVSPRAWDAAAGGPSFSEFVTDYDYDGANRLTRIALPAAANETRHFVHRAYDADGNLKMVSLPVAIADPSTTPLPNEHKTTLTHFDTGQVHTSDDGVNPIIRYDYTPEGWQLSRTPVSRDGKELIDQQMRWSYFDDGMLQSVKERDGNPTTYAYDANNNLKAASDASGATTADQDRVDIEAVYDSLDQATKVRHRKAADGNWTFTTYSYDANGNVTNRVDDGKESPDGTTVDDGRRHVFSYNRADWLTSQIDHKGASACQKVETTYDATGSEQLRSILRAGASCGSNPNFSLKQKTTWDYFLNDKLKRLETTNGQGAVVEAHDVDYVTDAGIYMNGHRVSDNAVLKGPGNEACNTSACRLSYTYDGRDRVTKEHRGGNLIASYELDPQSNIVKEVKDGIENAMTYSGNRLDTQTKTDLATGQSVKQRYHYDPWGNVDCITLAAGTSSNCNPGDNTQPSPNLLADYDYDALNRLERYRSFTADGVTSTKDDTTRYTYDALDRLVKQDETHGAKSWTTTFSHVGLTSLVSKEAISGDSESSGKTYDYDAHGLRLSMTNTPKDTTQSAETYTYGYDVHGSVSLLLKDTGEAKASYGYSAYGQVDDKMSAGDKAKQSDGDIEDPLNAYRYSAKRFDTGSQTIDMGARRFGPDFNRFLQVDQYMGALADLSLSTDPLTANRYSLAGGNPITFVEVDGHVVVANGGGTAKKSGGGGGGGGGYTDGWAAGGGSSSASSGGSSPGSGTHASSASSTSAAIPQEDQGCVDTFTCVLQTAQIMTAPIADALTGGATRETREILGQDYVDEDTRAYGNVHMTTNVASFLIPGTKAARGTRFLDEAARHGGNSVKRGTTILGENMKDRVTPFATRTGARDLGFGRTTADEWARMSPRQRWKLNDGMLRARIREGDAFRSIGMDPRRPAAQRQEFDLLGSELLRLSERGIPVEHVSPDEVFKVLGRF